MVIFPLTFHSPPTCCCRVRGGPSVHFLRCESHGKRMKNRLCANLERIPRALSQAPSLSPLLGILNALSTSLNLIYLISRLLALLLPQFQPTVLIPPLKCMLSTLSIPIHPPRSLLNLYNTYLPLF